jgi:hypothetical protein
VGTPGASQAQQGGAGHRRDDPVWVSGTPQPRMATICRSTSRTIGLRSGASCSTAPIGRSRCCGSRSRKLAGLRVPSASRRFSTPGVPAKPASRGGCFIQQAVLQVLQAAWDPTFSEASYGFRP